MIVLFRQLPIDSRSFGFHLFNEMRKIRSSVFESEAFSRILTKKIIVRDNLNQTDLQWFHLYYLYCLAIIVGPWKRLPFRDAVCYHSIYVYCEWQSNVLLWRITRRIYTPCVCVCVWARIYSLFARHISRFFAHSLFLTNDIELPGNGFLSPVPAERLFVTSCLLAVFVIVHTSIIRKCVWSHWKIAHNFCSFSFVSEPGTMQLFTIFIKLWEKHENIAANAIEINQEPFEESLLKVYKVQVEKWPK